MDEPLVYLLLFTTNLLVCYSTAGKLRSERITADSVLSGKPILRRFFIRVTVDHSFDRL
jgi:hypothetical protein